MAAGEAARMADVRRWWSAAALVLGVLLASPAAASGQEGRQVAIDFFVGPVISSGRVVGMGGAFIGVGEGADGHLINPASFAVRYTYSGDDWFDWDYAVSWLNLGVGEETTLDRSGQEGVFDAATIAQLGFNLKFGRHGVGVHAVNQGFDVKLEEADGSEGTLTLEQGFGGLGYAYAFLEGALTVGGVLTSGTASLSAGGLDPLEVAGEGLLLGALWSPCRQPWRLGATLQTGVTGRQRTGDAEGWGALAPDAISVPTQLGVGGSWMFGPRTYNTCPSFGDWDEVSEVAPPRSFRRSYLLVAADLVVTGRTEDGYGAQAFLAGTLQRSGESSVLSVRLGAESEVWEGWLVVRAGSYWEPSRFAERSGRLHGTLGADLHLFEWIWDWKASLVVDLADRYSNIGVGVGLWH